MNLKYANEEVFEPSACLTNWYPTGKDYIGAHSDDERQMREVDGETFVVCVTYGNARKLRIRNKKTKKIVYEVVVKPNSVYVMAGKFQKEFTHEFPKSAKVTQPRVSFTFRDFVRTPKRKREN